MSLDFEYIKFFLSNVFLDSYYIFFYILGLLIFIFIFYFTFKSVIIRLFFFIIFVFIIYLFIHKKIEITDLWLKLQKDKKIYTP